jgi:hypothetical protein
MEIDAKHKALYAIYAEYQKDAPDMTMITPNAIGLDEDVFKMALVKLQNEEFIHGLHVPGISQQKGLIPVRVVWESVMPTRFGIEYVENKLEIGKQLTGLEKIRQLKEKFGRFGWEVLQNVTSQILSNMLSGG